MPPRSRATSTTTSPNWLRLNPTGSGSSRPSPCRTSSESVDEVARSLDELRADGVVLLANSAGTYLGQHGQDDLFAALDARSAVVFIHPAELPGPAVDGVPPFAADFLLDTTRAAYLLVRNGICRKYPNIKFILSHAGGFVPYASHRMAIGIMGDTGRSPADSLDDFAGFYFDTALSSSAAALPSLLAFAKPGHVTFGSDWPFAPARGRKAVRRRFGNLRGTRRGHPRGDRAHQCAGAVPAAGGGPAVRSRLGARSTASRVSAEPSCAASCDWSTPGSAVRAGPSARTAPVRPVRARCLPG